MIYLLIESVSDNGGEGTCAIPIFASKSKESCEQKHREVLIRNKLLMEKFPEFDPTYSIEKVESDID
jgi:hypothetical protein